MFVCCECCVLSGRGLCVGLITRPEESYLLWRVVMYDQETSKTRRLKPATGLWKIEPQWVVTPRKQTNNITLTSINDRNDHPHSLLHCSLAGCLTDQALLIHCTAKDFLTIRRVLNITNCCIRI
jgi:hypothetical protein